MKFQFKKEAEIHDKIYNGIIEELTLGVIGHVGACVVIRMPVRFRGAHADGLSNFCLTRSCGHVIKALYELFGLVEDGMVTINEFKDCPCRVVVDSHKNRVIGVGHFMEDKFLLFQDMLNTLIKEEKGEQHGEEAAR